MIRFFEITSTIHSGTCYTSNLLTNCGMSCYHEYVSWKYGFRVPTEIRVRSTSISRKPECVGDCSWLAGGVLNEIPPAIFLFHQLRDPLATINTMLKRDVPTAKTPGRQYMFRVLKENGYNVRKATSKGDFLVAAELWYCWQELILRGLASRPYFRYRIELMSPKLINDMRAFMGLSPIKSGLLQRAIKFTARANHKEADPGFVPVSWSQLPEKVVNMAAQFGYQSDPTDPYKTVLLA